MGIGVLGYILPILPGTIFMILAAYCFLNSSEKLYNRVVNHPKYGHPIKQYIENNFIDKNAKFLILVSIWMATFVSVYYININIYFNILTISLSIAGSLMVLKASS